MRYSPRSSNRKQAKVQCCIPGQIRFVNICTFAQTKLRNTTISVLTSNVQRRGAVASVASISAVHSGSSNFSSMAGYCPCRALEDVLEIFSLFLPAFAQAKTCQTRLIGHFIIGYVRNIFFLKVERWYKDRRIRILACRPWVIACLLPDF